MFYTFFICAYLFTLKRAFQQFRLYCSDAKKYPGYDMTYNETESNISKIAIGEYIRKQHLIDLLMDPERPLYEKWRIYESVYLPGQVRAPNMFAGGLMRDWGREN